MWYVCVKVPSHKMENIVQLMDLPTNGPTITPVPPFDLYQLGQFYNKQSVVMQVVDALIAHEVNVHIIHL